MVGKVVTVMNMKGGVGKTTVSMHVGTTSAALSYEGTKPKLKVLLIDYDPQFNLSQALLHSKRYFSLEKDRKTILSVLVEDQKDINPYHLQVPDNEKPPSVDDVAAEILNFNHGGKIDLVPSTLDLMYVALGHANTSIKPIESRFGKFIDECRQKYDLIIIDCHPAGSIFTKTSLRNSDHVVIPVVSQRYAVRGIGLMMTFIEAKKQGSVGPKPHILFNLTSRKDVSPEEKQIRANDKYKDYCFTNTLKKYTALTELDEGKGFAWSNRKSYSREAWSNVWMVTKEFLQRTEVLK